MRKKRITTLLTLCIMILMLLCIPVMADGSFSWSQDAENSMAEVTYWGNVDWLDAGVAPNYYTFFARLSGDDKHLITVSNSAYLTITSGVLNNTLFTDKIYWNHEFSTTQKTTTATSIKVKWGFDGFSGYKKLS